MQRNVLLAAVLAGILGCGPGGKRVSEPAVAGDAAFEKLADEIYWAHFDQRPQEGVEKGWHQYDGKLPDVTDTAIAAEIERLKVALGRLDDLDASTLSDQHQMEREVLRYALRGELFGWARWDRPHKDPNFYLDAINPSPYIVRDYAPIQERARAVIAHCKGLPSYLSQARANVRGPVPRTWLDIAVLRTTGTADFVDKDVRGVLAELGDDALEKDVAATLDVCRDVLVEHGKALEGLRPTVNDDFALGEADFLTMLADTQGVKIDLQALEAIAQADLDRNLKAIEEAARELDPKKSTREVVLAAAEKDKPADAAGVIALATAQARDLRLFLLEKKIVSIPTDDVAEVRESPPFQRWNAAFLDGAGVFEQKKLPSYYYISPPDPKWPKEEQLAYLPPKNDLIYITVHELWPGHFLHQLHVGKNPSKIMKSFCTYTMSEGWAHYTEEMMWAEGATGSDPYARIGMLKEALLRNVRFVVAIGLHTKGMSVEEATKLFQDKAFVDPGNARQQAVRGTFDPMFLSYTLGKLMIIKLREDWKAEKGADYTIGKFHDAFLDHACAPIPLIRQDMLGQGEAERAI